MDYIPPRGLWHSRFGRYGQVVKELEEFLTTTGKTGGNGELHSFEALRRQYLFQPPLDNLAIGDAAKALLRESLTKKFASGEKADKARLKAAAMTKFWEAESQCKLTNERLDGSCSAINAEDLWAIMLIRQEIQEVLGTFCWEKASRHFGWGPGSSTRVSYKNRYDAYKYSGIPHCTPTASTLATAAMRQSPLWFDQLRKRAKHHLKLVAGNEVLTVPKDDRTDRTIAREPCMNLYLQRGIGQCIRDRLKSVGIDLSTQDNNRNRCVGESSLDWATIDLSMASDTIAYNVVSRLFPPDWFEAMDSVRSTVGVVDDKTILYEKFSSMGNGFTFEMETCLFLGVVRVALRNHGFDVKQCLVYGDDIIVPVAVADSVIGLLSLIGMKTNEDKSFVDGPFRESCGMQTWYGTDISPFYVRRGLNETEDLFLFHNNLQRWLWRVGFLLERSDVEQVLKILRKCRKSCHSRQRFYIPDGFGDGGFIRPCNFLVVRRKTGPRDRITWEVASLPHLVDETEDLAGDEQSPTEFDGGLPEGAMLAALVKADQRRAFRVSCYRKVASVYDESHMSCSPEWQPRYSSDVEVFREFESSVPVKPVKKRRGFLGINTLDLHRRRLVEQWLEDYS